MSGSYTVPLARTDLRYYDLRQWATAGVVTDGMRASARVAIRASRHSPGLPGVVLYRAAVPGEPLGLVSAWRSSPAEAALERGEVVRHEFPVLQLLAVVYRPGTDTTEYVVAHDPDAQEVEAGAEPQSVVK